MPMHRVYPLRFSVEFHDLAFACSHFAHFGLIIKAHKLQIVIISSSIQQININQSNMKLFLLSTSAILFTNGAYAAQDYTATKVSYNRFI